MRWSGRLLFATGLLLALCAPDGALAIVKEPVTGGLHTLPGGESSAQMTTPALEPPPPEPAPAPAAQPPAPTVDGKVDDTSWGLLVRGGYFGLPDFIADELFVEHPKVTGSSFGAEIRYHGEGGGRGGASIGLAVDTATTKSDEGVWRQDEDSNETVASGEFSMLAITLTGYWSLFPSWYVHPYVGIGIGAAHVEGYYQDEEERVDADIWVPVLHIPVGLAIELGQTFQLAIEGRFLDGIAIGGALQVRF